MQNYYLAKDLYVCKSAGHAVFLDLKRDRYLALPPDQASTLGKLVPDLDRRLFSSDGEPIEGGKVDDLAQTLEREGIIVSDESLGRRATEVVPESARETFRSGAEALPQLRWAYLYDFAVSWLRANAMLRCLPIRSIVRRIEARKRPGNTDVAGVGVEAAKRMASIFFLVQPIFYSANDACLRDSLTLLEFLARYDIYPQWIFGVHLRPFAAHCWVQHDGVVLNDTAEHVKEFTPLMAI